MFPHPRTLFTLPIEANHCKEDREYDEDGAESLKGGRQCHRHN
jgi:hypothetical protein